MAPLVLGALAALPEKVAFSVARRHEADSGLFSFSSTAARPRPRPRPWPRPRPHFLPCPLSSMSSSKPGLSKSASLLAEASALRLPPLPCLLMPPRPWRLGVLAGVAVTVAVAAATSSVMGFGGSASAWPRARPVTVCSIASSAAAAAAPAPPLAPASLATLLASGSGPAAASAAPFSLPGRGRRARSTTPRRHSRATWWYDSAVCNALRTTTASCNRRMQRSV
mmetsp:Transcript_67832/g.219175  ORF Transcript_67832/g.219175 Transcript_67832/m.219175 type:complete len:224 (-) Transcript_67832:746-1417(-)